MDFCLSATPEAPCMAAAHFRRVCYTKNIAVVQENILATSDEVTLLWCEDGTPS